MAWITLFVFGALHGLQPDHLAAAAALAARTGGSAVSAAARVAAGHALALGLVALAVWWLPGDIARHLEPWADALAALSLMVIGGAVLLQALRAKYLVHAHPHRHDGSEHEHLHAHPSEGPEQHEHGHLRAAVAVGLVLGIGGARSLVVLLPAIAGPGTGLWALGLYALGIFVGVAGLARLLEMVRRQAEQRALSRWLDGLIGAGALVAGVQLMMDF